MAEALRTAAHDAGLRITLLDTAYLTGGIDAPLEGAQRRFGDHDADAWAARVAAIRPDDTLTVGAAIHSVRAVPLDAIPTIAAHATGRPLHVHLSEQRLENEQSLATFGATPTRVLEDAGALGPDTTAIHAVHVTPEDVAILGSTRTGICLCPSTEQDLGDGIAPGDLLCEPRAPACASAATSTSAPTCSPRPGRSRCTSASPARRAASSHPSSSSSSSPPAATRASATRRAAASSPAPAPTSSPSAPTPRARPAPTPRSWCSSPAAPTSTRSWSAASCASTGGRHVLGDVGAMLGTAIRAAWEGAR